MGMDNYSTLDEEEVVSEIKEPTLDELNETIESDK